MRALHLLIWILLEQTMASREILYVQGIQEESVNISCEPNQGKPPPTAFRLYRKSDQNEEKGLLLISEHQDIESEYKGRVKISKHSLNVINITLLDLRSKDTGLYVCEFITAADQQKMLIHTEIVLLVKVKEADCSCNSHSSLIYAISVAVGLLLFTLLSLSAACYRKLKAHAEPLFRNAVPIYEEMIANKPLNPHLTQTDLPAIDPVYAAPQKAGRPECHYAVPRKASHQQEFSPALAVQLDLIAT